MGQFVRNFFVQLSNIKEGTPEYKDYVSFVKTRYNNILRKQLYLQSHGVSFSYTDKQTYRQVEDLITICKEQDDEVNSQMQ